jgi:hypothetical protein
MRCARCCATTNDMVRHYRNDHPDLWVPELSWHESGADVPWWAVVLAGGGVASLLVLVYVALSVMPR